ncbi:MAG: hypothetical protein ABIF11_10785 [Nitrospirota bacterium]
MDNTRTKASEKQIIYANILNIGMWTGLLILTVSFAIYISGILPSFIPIEKLPEYWGMKVKEYVHILNAPTGWGWITMVGKGDYLNFIGIAILAGLTIPCYLSILPFLIRKKDIPYIIIVILEIIVLSLAASGILTVGGE